MEIGIFMSNDWWYAALVTGATAWFTPLTRRTSNQFTIRSERVLIETDWQTENSSGKIGENRNIIYSCVYGTSAFDQNLSTWCLGQFFPRGALIRFCCLACKEETRLRWASVTVAMNEDEMMMTSRRINKQAGLDCQPISWSRCQSDAYFGSRSDESPVGNWSKFVKK